MAVSTPNVTDFTSQSATAYKTQIDDNSNVAQRLAWAFAPHEQDVGSPQPDMTVRLEAGALFAGITLTEVAEQDTAVITAPTTNPRIDRVVIDDATGTVSVITGSEAPSPSPPTITVGKLPICQVALVVSQTSIVNADITDERVAPGSGDGGLPRSYLTGLTLSNNGTDAVNDIDIAVGEARSTADDENLTVTSAIGKQIDVSWAAGGTPGSPTGGLSSSLTLTNDTAYHVILGLVSGTVEIGFDTSITGANLVTDHSFTNTRRIGSVERGTATNLAFTQTGDRFILSDPPLDVNLTTTSSTGVNVALTVPLGVKVLALFNASVLEVSALSRVYFSSPDANNEAPANTTAPLHNLRGPDGTVHEGGQFEVLTNISSEVRYRTENTACDLYIATLGWVDRRGRDD